MKKIFKLAKFEEKKITKKSFSVFANISRTVRARAKISAPYGVKTVLPIRRQPFPRENTNLE